MTSSQEDLPEIPMAGEAQAASESAPALRADDALPDAPPPAGAAEPHTAAAAQPPGDAAPDASSDVDAPGGPSAAARRTERRLIVGVLLVGLLHGLIYLLIVPPWQHYEEPSHFEHAWLIAETGQLPVYPAFANDKRREIAASMLDHGFYRDLAARPDPVVDPDPVYIGVNVTGAPPLYPVLASVPLRLTAGGSIEAQVYSVRLLSLSLFVLTLFLAYLIVAELTPLGHALRWSVPAALALTPGFADMMTAISNDVGATAMFSLFLWASVRMVRRGFSPLRLLGVLGAAWLCVLTKNTVLLALPISAVALFLSVWSRVALTRPAGSPSAPANRWLTARRLLFGALAALPLLGVLAGFWSTLDRGDAALWTRATDQETPTRVEVGSAAPWGEHVIGLSTLDSPARDVQLRQLLPLDQVVALRGKTITVGAWMWATRPIEAQSPALLQGDVWQSRRIQLDTRPTFVALPAQVDDEALTLQVVLAPRVGDDGDAAPVTIYYDGILAVEGGWPISVEPRFDDSGAQRGMWAGRPFDNLVRNGSAETSGLWVRPWAEKLGRDVAAQHLSPTRLLGGLLDGRNNRLFFQASATRLFETFWGRFAWSNVALPSGWYDVLLVLTALGALGAAIRLAVRFRGYSSAQRLALIWLAVAALTIWGGVFMRGLFTALEARPYIPTARYAYPAAIPTLLLLVAGWQMASWPRQLRAWWPILFWVAFLVVDVVSVNTIFSFFLGR